MSRSLSSIPSILKLLQHVRQNTVKRIDEKSFGFSLTSLSSRVFSLQLVRRENINFYFLFFSKLMYNNKTIIYCVPLSLNDACNNIMCNICRSLSLCKDFLVLQKKNFLRAMENVNTLQRILWLLNFWSVEVLRYFPIIFSVYKPYHNLIITA